MAGPEGTASPPPGPTGAGLARLNGAPAGRAALAYAELGWPVMPIAGMAGGRCGCRAGPACEHPAKHPLVPGGARGAARTRRKWPSGSHTGRGRV